MARTKNPGRPNQRMRTRKDLLRAAARLLKQGRTPSLEEIAEEAMVSRATAYRYFLNAEAALVESALDIEVPEPEDLFADNASTDPVARMEDVDDLLHNMVMENEVAFRLMLANSLERRAKGHGDDMPVRQNRRKPLIEAALEPIRAGTDPEEFEMLSRALSLVVGTDAIIVLKDVLQLDEADTLKVKRWVIKTLVDAVRDH